MFTPEKNKEANFLVDQIKDDFNKIVSLLGVDYDNFSEPRQLDLLNVIWSLESNILPKLDTLYIDTYEYKLVFDGVKDLINKLNSKDVVDKNLYYSNLKSLLSKVNYQIQLFEIPS